MFNTISLGVYYPANSFVHRLQARTKLLLIVWLAVFFTIANHRFWHFAPYILAIVLLFGSVALAGISPGYLWQRLRLLILFALIGIIPTLIFFSSSDAAHPPLGIYGPLPVPYGTLRLVMAGYGIALLLYIAVTLLPLSAIRQGRRARWFRRVRVLLILLAVAAVIFLWVTRDKSPAATLPLGPFVLASDAVWLIFSLFVVFLTLYSFSLILTMTTSPIALIEGLTMLLKPLRLLRLPVDDFALMTLIALRFIPTLLEEVDLLVKAQLSRGADMRHGRIRERLQSLAALFIPFIHGTLRRAADLATALEARGYEVEGRQTMLHETSLRLPDYVTAGAVMATTIAMLFL
jgi:energy-coupling factor transport system permease protein